MHSLKDIRKEYDRLDRLCGLDTSGIVIELSRRRSRRLGCFWRPRKNGSAPLRIVINPTLLEEEEQFWDTIRHEYAHAAVYLRHPGEKHGHDKLWKDTCRELGCSPERLAPLDEAYYRRMQKTAKYRVHCNNCGRDTYYFREGKIIKTLRQGGRAKLCCASCGSQSFSLYVRK